MATEPAKPAFSLEYIEADRDSKGQANWRVCDRDDNRIATCFDLSNAKRVVAALNYEHDAPTLRLQIADGPVFPVPHALNGDPYHVEGSGFAHLWRQAETASIGDAGPEGAVEMRIFVDVELSHSMLDDLGIPMGYLGQRIAVALLRAGSTIPSIRVEQTDPGSGTPIDPDAVERINRRLDQRRRDNARPPRVDPVPDGVRVPEAAAVIDRIVNMTGEAAFRMFDRLKLVGTDRDEIQSWILTDPESVAAMIRSCCSRALAANRLTELAKEVGL